ncbi:hypothetical protein HZH66_013386 [Vespula vulgaris]|uniref:Uncharacterized protein n=1 Tax=Vespula vulgaris TaxID=7454 RepID=A0A834MTC5_VESVU|nr:hypothetical protein HZH66_013386 [Vespula vulgaris]
MKVKHIKSVANNKDKIIIYNNSCTGQIRNIKLALSLLKLVESSDITTKELGFVDAENGRSVKVSRFGRTIIAQWLERLQHYDFENIHRRRMSYDNADSLSRRPCEETQCGYCARKMPRADGEAKI